MGQHATKIDSEKIFCRGISSQSSGGFWRSEGPALVRDNACKRIVSTKEDKQLVKVVGSRNDHTLYDIFSGEELAKGVSSRQLKRIRVNNKIRSTLRNALARLALSDPDPQVRSEAAQFTE